MKISKNTDEDHFFKNRKLLPFAKNCDILKISSNLIFVFKLFTNQILLIMKKIILIAIIAICSVSLNAQNFGVKAGVDFASARVDGFGSTSETGFFVGAFTSFNLSDKIMLQPELLYVNVKDLDFISLPLLVKFSVAEKFNLLAGPSLTYFLDAEDEEFQLNLDLGVSFDVMENLDINAKYSYMLNKDWGVDGFFIGLGYKF